MVPEIWLCEFLHPDVAQLSCRNDVYSSLQPISMIKWSTYYDPYFLLQSLHWLHSGVHQLINPGKNKEEYTYINA